MIARIWHGWTTLKNAETYQNLLLNEIFPSIAHRNIIGYKKMTLLKRQLERELEFITIMIFDNIDAVREFAGQDYEKSYVPQKARDVLLRHDESSQHYEVIHESKY